MRSRSSLFIIFTTVFLDLIGFGIVIPLVAIYGKHFGASSLQLALLGAVYSFMQFFFAPVWGNLSDRWGRRPILLISLAGSTTSYFLFGLAPSFYWLFASRAFAGIFAANISAAQAYIADITTPADRARGMGLIGAAFGIGFTLGPPLGGIASAKIALWAPGVIAGTICGLNLLLAFLRLPESLSPELRQVAKKRAYSPLNLDALSHAFKHPLLWVMLLTFFLATFAFSNVEQTISLLFQSKFHLTTEFAGLKTGLVLMWAGFLGAAIQGGMIRKLAAKYGERKLLIAGLLFNVIGFGIFPFAPTYGLYYLFVIPMTVGSALLNPSLSSLISKSAPASEQGATMGLSQGLASLARAGGPFLGLLTFGIHAFYPFAIACVVSLALFIIALSSRERFRAVKE